MVGVHAYKLWLVYQTLVGILIIKSFREKLGLSVMASAMPPSKQHKTLLPLFNPLSSIIYIILLCTPSSSFQASDFFFFSDELFSVIDQRKNMLDMLVRFWNHPKC